MSGQIEMDFDPRPEPTGMVTMHMRLVHYMASETFFTDSEGNPIEWCDMDIQTRHSVCHHLRQVLEELEGGGNE